MNKKVLLEDVSLTKGSQRILSDKSLVANLGAALRDEAKFKPAAFAPGAAKALTRLSDIDAAKWFLEQIDAIEKQGYDGTIYSRDGVNSDWIARQFATGRANWEDISGNLNMLLRDWYLLKTRNLLEPKHTDLQKFHNINQLGQVLTAHYQKELADARDKAKQAALQKSAKSLKLIDNDDYKVFVPLNRRAALLLGDKSAWCTANAEYDAHYHTYATKAMLFVLLPYYKDETGKKTLVPTEVVVKQGPRAGSIVMSVEKYQFDSGSGDFMTISNTLANPQEISTKYPYLYQDIVEAMTNKKLEIEQAFDTYSNDPSLTHKDLQIKKYSVDKQIKDLFIFVRKGYLTLEKRPVEGEVIEPDAQLAQIPTNQLSRPPEQQMESINQLAQKMLDGYFDNLIGDSDGFLNEDITSADPVIKIPKELVNCSPQAAPIMPESINSKGNIMEKVDKDIAQMLHSLKKYDMLTESAAPVLMARPQLVEKGKPEWLLSAEEKAEGKDDDIEELDEAMPSEKAKERGKPSKKPLTPFGDQKKDDKPKEKVKEEADPEVIAWMARFAKLGNMNGYGR